VTAPEDGAETVLHASATVPAPAVVDEMVGAESVPTFAVAVPDPADVKYASAAPAAISAPTRRTTAERRPCLELGSRKLTSGRSRCR
jgi:hypothetical protein